MNRYKLTITMGAAVVFFAFLPVFAAETWHWEKNDGWNSLSAAQQGKYIADATKLKELVSSGQSKKAEKAINQLKKDFPQVCGEDFDEFMKAEILYSKVSFVKASRAYDTFLDKYPASPFYDAAMERQFEIGTAFLNGMKKTVLFVFRIKGYEEGVKIMDKLSDRAGASPIGLKAALAVAESYERRGKFVDAYYKWSEISSRWPVGEIGNRALLGMARCEHAAYQGPKYDSSNLASAKSYYETYEQRYPEDANKYYIADKIHQIEEQLAYKQFCIGDYYRSSDNTTAASMYYQAVIADWANTTSVTRAKAQMDLMEKESKKEVKWTKKLMQKIGKILL